MPTIEQLRSLVCHDLDPDFIEAAAQAIAWEYHLLFEELATDFNLTDEVRGEEFGRRRGARTTRALVAAARKYGVPFEFRHLDCNGQNKLLIKAGRVIILQEPIASLTDRPKPADYKLELADVHAMARQLELPLGDRPLRITDWSGCVLGALLHGAKGPRWTREHRMLGGLFLGVPDTAYDQWVLRLDLHRIAMYGRNEVDASSVGSTNTETAPEQPDEVFVASKRNRARGAS